MMQQSSSTSIWKDSHHKSCKTSHRQVRSIEREAVCLIIYLSLGFTIYKKGWWIGNYLFKLRGWCNAHACLLMLYHYLGYKYKKGRCPETNAAINVLIQAWVIIFEIWFSDHPIQEYWPETKSTFIIKPEKKNNLFWA